MRTGRRKYEYILPVYANIYRWELFNQSCLGTCRQSPVTPPPPHPRRQVVLFNTIPHTGKGPTVPVTDTQREKRQREGKRRCSESWWGEGGGVELNKTT